MPNRPRLPDRSGVARARPRPGARVRPRAAGARGARAGRAHVRGQGRAATASCGPARRPRAAAARRERPPARAAPNSTTSRRRGPGTCPSRLTGAPGAEHRDGHHGRPARHREPGDARRGPLATSPRPRLPSGKMPTAPPRRSTPSAASSAVRPDAPVHRDLAGRPQHGAEGPAEHLLLDQDVRARGAPPRAPPVRRRPPTWLAAISTGPVRRHVLRADHAACSTPRARGTSPTRRDQTRPARGRGLAAHRVTGRLTCRDEVEHRLHGLLEVQRRRVDRDHAVGGRPELHDRRVVGVATHHLVAGRRDRGRVVGPVHLAGPAGQPGLLARGQQEPHVRIRGDHRRDVAPLGDDAACRRCDPPACAPRRSPHAAARRARRGRPGWWPRGTRRREIAGARIAAPTSVPPTTNAAATAGRGRSAAPSHRTAPRPRRRRP